VSKEKEQTTVELQERERLARELEEEKQQLEEATTHLKAGLIVSASSLPLCSPSLAPKGAHL
jgi:transposase-like protein